MRRRRTPAVTANADCRVGLKRTANLPSHRSKHGAQRLPVAISTFEERPTKSSAIIALALKQSFGSTYRGIPYSEYGGHRVFSFLGGINAGSDRMLPETTSSWIH